MRIILRVGFRCLALAAVVALIIPSAGCIGMIVQAANLFGMNDVPAEFNGLRGRRVAVVCQSPQYSDQLEAATERLTDELERYLQGRVRRISFVARDEVNDRLESRSGDIPDFQRLGKAVDADAVLVVDINAFSTQDNQTIYQGKCDYSITVYDINNDEIVFEKDNPEFAHPKRGGYQLTEMPPDKFHREFVKFVAADIGRFFHSNEFPEQFAKETYIR